MPCALANNVKWSLITLMLFLYIFFFISYTRFLLLLIVIYKKINVKLTQQRHVEFKLNFY